MGNFYYRNSCIPKSSLSVNATKHVCCYPYTQCFNSLPSDKILDWCKLKAFADDKINANEILKFGLGRVENIAGKGKKCWLPLPTLFSIRFLLKVVQSRDCVVKSCSFSKQALAFTCPLYKSFENTVGKRRNCS